MLSSSSDACRPSARSSLIIAVTAGDIPLPSAAPRLTHSGLVVVKSEAQLQQLRSFYLLPN